jgi:hypothetical protein
LVSNSILHRGVIPAAHYPNHRPYTLIYTDVCLPRNPLSQELRFYISYAVEFDSEFGVREVYGKVEEEGTRSQGWGGVFDRMKRENIVPSDRTLIEFF